MLFLKCVSITLNFYLNLPFPCLSSILLFLLLEGYDQHQKLFEYTSGSELVTLSQDVLRFLVSKLPWPLVLCHISIQGPISFYFRRIAKAAGFKVNTERNNILGALHRLNDKYTPKPNDAPTTSVLFTYDFPLHSF